MHLEIQEGKKPMRLKKYSKEHGGTAGCSLRLIERSSYAGLLSDERQVAVRIGKREMIIADSWFASLRLCRALVRLLRHEFFGAVKTSHAGVPKEWVEKIMKNWPGGSYLVLECEEEGLFFVGYKYNYRKKGKPAR